MNWKIIRKNDFLIFCGLVFFSFVLRVLYWNKFPPGFTADEATMGYDAYSLIKTGRDQFGNSWPLAFRSFGDYRPPLYIWSVIPFELIFGLTPLAVRLPSMIAGSLEVLMIYFLGKELISKKAGIAAAILLTLSPWSFLQTRFAQEANLSTLGIFTGVLFAVYWFKRKKIIYLILSSIAFSLSFYAYHNARLTVPLIIGGGMAILWRSKKLRRKDVKQVIAAAIVSAFFLFPLLNYARKFPEAIFRRALGQSVFTDLGIQGALWKDIVTMPPGYPIWLSRLQHNKPLYYGRVIIRGYFSHFDPRFLFFTGDPHERFRTPYSGLLNWMLLFFIPIGFWRFFQGDERHEFILWWLLASPVVASLSTIVPNSQHAQDMIIPLHLLAGAGAVLIWKRILLPAKFGIIGSFLLAEAWFLYGYFWIIPRNSDYLQNWYYYDPFFTEIQNMPERKIVFVDGLYYINWAWFLRYDPKTFQQEVVVQEADNKAYFDRVISFGIYYFQKTLDEMPLEYGTLYVRRARVGEPADDGFSIEKRISWPDNFFEYRFMRKTS